MKKAKGDYPYLESGLDNVVLKGITVYTCSCGEEMPEIPNIEGLHKEIAFAVIHKKALLAGPEIRFLRKEMDLKAKDLAELLGASNVSVSRWERGEKPIGHANDRAFRLLYIRRIEEALRKIIPGVIDNILKNISTESIEVPPINIPVHKLKDFHPHL